MTSRRIVQGACVCGVGLVLASVFIFVRASRTPSLPILAPYRNLPVQFRDALQRARGKAVAPVRSADDVRELAHLYQANRLFPEARACYRVIAASPDGLAARDHYYLAAIAQDENDLPGAEVELRATLLAEPGYVPARLALADALFKSGQADEAGKEYATILGADANQPQAAFGMARVELQRGDEKGAIARLKALISHHPEATSGAALLSQLLDRRGDTEASAAMRELSRQTHEPVPADPWMKLMMADCYDLERLGMMFEEYRLDGQMSEAVPLLRRLEELDPTGWIPPMLHGWSDKEEGRYPEAVQEYMTALKRGGDPERICPLLVAAMLSEGKPKEAAALLQNYRSRSPHSIPILLSYAEVAVRLKDTPLARALLEEVLKADPFLYMPNMSMVQILWTSGEHDAAAQCLQRVAKVFPADIDSRGMLGQYYLEKSDPWSAINPLEQAVGIVPIKDPRRNRLKKMLDTAYLTAGSLEASHGQFSKAEEFAKKSITLVPEGLRGYALQANVCRTMKDFKGATDALTRMTALDPDNPTLLLNLGDVSYQGGDRDRAREAWQRALQLAPAGASELRTALGIRLSDHISADTFP